MPIGYVNLRGQPLLTEEGVPLLEPTPGPAASTSSSTNPEHALPSRLSPTLR